MKLEELIPFLSNIWLTYPNPPSPMKDVVAAWHSHFSDTPMPIFAEAYKKACKEAGNFLPGLGAVLAQLSQYHGQLEFDEKMTRVMERLNGRT